MDANIVRRVTFAAVAIPLALGVVWYGGLPLVAVVTVVSVLGTRELYLLAARQGVEPSMGFGLAAALLIPLLAYHVVERARLHVVTTRFEDPSISWPYWGMLWLVAVLCWALHRRAPAARPLSAVAVTTFGVLYAAALPSFLIAIRHGQHGLKSWPGTWLVFFPLVVIWICDTAAMFGGRAIGGPKLAPSISPGKTRSGALSGVVGGLLVVPVFVHAFFRPNGLNLPWGALFCIAAVISVLGQAGDLAESLFKREAGVKDSSNLIPGHGGVLDRFDSLYFALPLTALGYRLFGIL